MPIVHPTVPIVIVTVYLVLEAVSDFVGHGLSTTRGVGPSGEGEHANLVVDATAFGFPFSCGEQTDDHFVGVALGLALVDGNETEFVGIMMIL